MMFMKIVKDPPRLAILAISRGLVIQNGHIYGWKYLMVYRRFGSTDVNYGRKINYIYSEFLMKYSKTNLKNHIDFTQNSFKTSNGKSYGGQHMLYNMFF